MSVEGNIRNANRMYIPTEDSYLLVETIKRYSGKKALEVGVGSGIITKELSKNFEVVIGTDSNLDSVIFAKGSLSRKTQLICCNMCDTIRSKFDLIVSNPPYLRDLRIAHEK
ncbi:MAG TPA: methyltransferase, partial [Nitrososphaeraceae archaeon]